jgi:hypothetical protein
VLNTFNVVAEEEISTHTPQQTLDECICKAKNEGKRNLFKTLSDV